MANTLRDHVDFEMIRHLVSRAIMCPVTGGSLDVRTCHVVRDRDGDPAFVMAPGAWASVPEDNRKFILAQGYTLDTRAGS